MLAHRLSQTGSFQKTSNQIAQTMHHTHSVHSVHRKIGLSLLFALLTCTCLAEVTHAQNVGIGTTNPAPSALLELHDTSRGLLIPRLTTQQRNAIQNPAHSLIIFNLDCNWYEYYDQNTGSWLPLLPATTPSASAPILLYPASGITPSSFVAQWSSQLPITGYWLDVAYDPAFTSYVPNWQNVPEGTSTTDTVTELTCNTWYYFRVRAQTSCGATLYSNIQAVKTTGPDYCGNQPTNSWQQLTTPPATIALRENQVIATAGGKVYFGMGGRGGVSSICYYDWWMYDPCSGSWTQLPSIPSTPEPAGGGLAFAFVIGDTIYVGGGGWKCGNYYRGVFRWIPQAGVWQAIAPLPAGRRSAAATSDGHYGYVFGGVLADGTITDTIWRYDPATNTWQFLTVYPGGGRVSPFLAYYNGKLYAGTGADAANNCTADFYVYDLTNGTWTQLPNYPVAQFESKAVALPSGKIVVTGGHPSCNTCTNQFYYYDINAGVWKPLSVFPGGPRNDLHLTYWNGALFGGFGHNCSGTYIRDWWLWCPE